MNDHRLEVVLPADVSARDCSALAHAIWAVLSAAGLDADGSLRFAEDFDGESPEEFSEESPGAEPDGRRPDGG